MDGVILAVLGAAFSVLIALSSFFSASETAYSTMNVIRIKALANEGDRRAAKALAHSEDYERLLTTILVGNNLVNIAASAIGTMIFTELFGLAGVAYATAFMATVILAFGEITPKTLARRNAERYAIALAGPLRAAEVALSPIAAVFMKMTGALSKGAKNDSAEMPSFTEDELVVIIDEIEEEGTLKKRESDLIKSAIQFDDVQVSEILTPRVDMVAAEEGSGPEELKELFLRSEFSRIPIYDGTVDQITGIVNFKDFFSRYSAGGDFLIKDLAKPPTFVSETESIATLLKDLQKARSQMAIVSDEFGGTLGVVTVEDAVEELVGEIWDEDDEVKYPVQREGDGSYTVLGDANIHDAMEQMGLEFDPKGFQAHSVSGFIHHMLERIPKTGDVIETDNATIIVKSMKSRRIKEARIIPDPERAESEESSAGE
ncbi:MAG: hemolysin family protein [Candidatus Methanoplasma sp.]|nr:hemolysin family protein [Candidatus Methanoplasma sp.]